MRSCETCEFYEPKDSTCHREPPNAVEATARLQWFVFQKVRPSDWCRAHEPGTAKGTSGR